MLVKATKAEIFYGKLRKVGTQFECPTEKEFSKNWMTKVVDFEVEVEVEVEVFDNSEVTKGEDIKRESLEIPSLINKPKQKRKRRTPAEMEAARAEEAKKES